MFPSTPKFLRRVVSLLAILGSLALPSWSDPGSAAKPHGTVVNLKGNREPFTGYLIKPEGKGPFPAVVVIMEWWGLNDQIRGVADRLAREGYVALVPDLYHGHVTTDPEKAHELLRALDDQDAISELGSAMEYLRSLPEVGKSRIGSLGFCMGGGLSLRLALHRSDLSGAVMFYGQPETDPAELKGAACPVLGLFGEDDQGILHDRIMDMAKGLNRVGKGAEVQIYSAAGHAFFNETRPSYSKEAAEDAWKRTLAFFGKHLKG